MSRWLTLLLLAVAAAAPARAADEAALKAVVIYKLLMFTEWPAEAAPAGRVVLCLAGGSALAAPLRSLQGQPVGNHLLDVHEVGGDALPPRRCHAWVIDAGRGAAALPRGHDAVLVITDDPAAADAAVVRLFVQNERIAFDVSLVQARRRGIRLSSKLLRLASSVAE